MLPYRSKLKDWLVGFDNSDWLHNSHWENELFWSSLAMLEPQKLTLEQVPICQVWNQQASQIRIDFL